MYTIYGIMKQALITMTPRNVAKNNRFNYLKTCMKIYLINTHKDPFNCFEIAVKTGFSLYEWND